MNIKTGAATKLFTIMNYIFLSVISILALVPFIAVLSGSVTDEKELIFNGVGLIPGVFSTEAYKQLFGRRDEIIDSYKVTLFITVAGTFLSMLFTSMLSYITSIKQLKLRNHFSFYVYFTMLFNGGMIPWYILCVRYLGLKDQIWALILPMLINPYYVFLIRNYFRGVPDSLRESGKIDGAGELLIFVKIILPVSKPVLATVGLFYMLAYWNDFYLALFFIESKKLFPLQYHLYRIVSNMNYIANASADISSGNAAPNIIAPTESIKFATTIVTIGPILFLYPFVQKYFIKGIMIGSIKG